MSTADDHDTEPPTGDYGPFSITVDSDPIEDHNAPFVRTSTLTHGHGNYLRILAAKRTPQIRGESDE